MTSLYRSVFKKALKIVLERKYLILFGAFASVMFSEGEFRFLSQGVSISSSHPQIFSTFSNMIASGFFTNLWENLVSLWNNNTLETTGYILLLLVGVVVFSILSIFSQIGIILGTIQKKQKLRSILKASSPYFWKTVFVHLLMKLGIMFGIGILLAPLSVTLITIPYLEFVLFLAFFLVLIPFLTFATMANKYAIIAVASKNLGIIDSIKYALQITNKEWFVSLETLILLLVARIFGYFLMVIAILVLLFPFLAGFLIAMYFQFYSAVTIFFFISLFLGAILTLVFGAGLNAFQHISWVLVFEEISHGRAIPKLERLFGKRQKPAKNAVQKSVTETLETKTSSRKKVKPSQRKNSSTVRTTSAPRTRKPRSTKKK